MKVDELKYGKEYYEKKLCGKWAKFTMGSDGDLYWKETLMNGAWEKVDDSLAEILSYRFEEVEKQFPQIGDKYYVIGMVGGQHLSIVSFRWHGLEGERRMLSLGNVFETVEEAKEMEQRIINEVLKK